MKCDNCKKREANVQYSENINGVKKELHLCEECSKKLGITDQMNFHIGLDFPSIFGGIFEDFADFAEPSFTPLLNEIRDVKCETCGISFDDIVNTGRLGCPDCYETFESRLDQILKRMQGSNRHVGRLGKVTENKINVDQQNKLDKHEKEIKAETEIEKLEKDLKLAIKEERYEDAAKIRDEIKKLSKWNAKNIKRTV